jgi:hypothetical protein
VVRILLVIAGPHSLSSGAPAEAVGSDCAAHRGPV